MEGLVLQEADAEPPERLPVSDEAGFLVGWREVPLLKCITCGKPTRRTIITGVFVDGVSQSEMQFSLEQAAECVACGKGREATRIKGRALVSASVP